MQSPSGVSLTLFVFDQTSKIVLPRILPCWDKRTCHDQVGIKITFISCKATYLGKNIDPCERKTCFYKWQLKLSIDLSTIIHCSYDTKLFLKLFLNLRHMKYITLYLSCLIKAYMTLESFLWWNNRNIFSHIMFMYNNYKPYLYSHQLFRR